MRSPASGERAEWAAHARHIERLGFSTLLCPDGTGTFAPFQALSAAAAVTSTLRLGTYVLASPLRTPGEVAWESASLDVFSGGRLELGLGAGRPDAERDAARLGVPFGTPGERIRRIEQTLQVLRTRFARSDEASRYDAVRGVQKPQPAVLVAGNGPRMLHLAAREADTLALGLPPHSTEDDLEAKANQVRRSPATGLTGSNSTSISPWSATITRLRLPPGSSGSPGPDPQRLDHRARRVPDRWRTRYCDDGTGPQCPTSRSTLSSPTGSRR